ncbi:MAG: DUF11 domain-containing protein [Candidatus Peribacteria bacterium]|nr:MAG: DUF11 domain-containing protein [Candidatus Peribacteria bacterium]
MSGGNTEVCNIASYSTNNGDEGISDDLNTGSPDTWTCVFGYDLVVDKSILTRGEYVTAYTPEYVTYPAYIYEGGPVQLGDWYVYRIEVTNNGVGDAYEVVTTDTFPAGVTSYWFESQALPGVTITPDTSNGTMLTWTIPYLPAE